MEFPVHLASPYWLLGLIVVFCTFYFRKPLRYIAKTHIAKEGLPWITRLWRGFPSFLFFLAALSFILALTDPTRTYSIVKDEKTVNRILVAVDNSSSMYNFSAPGPIYCTDETVDRVYPRIGITCRALHRLIEDTQKFSLAHPEKSKDRIGIVRFALYSKVRSYPTSNYATLHRLVDEMNWVQKVDGNDIWTEIHLGLWDLFLLALKRNINQEEGFEPLTHEAAKILALALTPELDARKPLRLPPDIKKKFLKIKEELRDTFFIIFTDAHTGQLEQRFNKVPVSFKKMIDLAELLELPIYIISSEEDNALFKEQVQRTGFGEKPREYRGDFLVVRRGGVTFLDDMATLASTVLEKRFGRVVPTFVVQRKSYVWHFTILALTLLAAGILSKEILTRSLSDE